MAQENAEEKDSDNFQEQRAPEYSEQREFIIDSKKERFAFAPGSSVPAFERNVNAPRRKKPKDDVYPTLTAPIAPPSEYYNDPSIGIKIVPADRSFPERSDRKVFRSGAFKQPTTTWPVSWMASMEIDYEHPENGHNVIQWELSADRKEIRGRKRPAAPGMEKPVDAAIFAVDSDAAAEAAEAEEAEQEK
jgi:hypothetical protein